METNKTFNVTDGYIPQSDPKKLPWVSALAENIAAVGAILGLPPTLITAGGDAAQNLKDGINNVAIKRNELAQAIEDKERIKAESLQVIRTIANTIKTLPGYTTAMGKQLGLVSSTQSVDISTLQPELKLTGYPGYVMISYNKKRANAVRIYSRIQGSPKWERITESRISPYKDTRALKETGKPEIREYAAICFNGDNEIGQMSQIVSITFGVDNDAMAA